MIIITIYIYNYVISSKRNWKWKRKMVVKDRAGDACGILDS